MRSCGGKGAHGGERAFNTFARARLSVRCEQRDLSLLPHVSLALLSIRLLCVLFRSAPEAAVLLKRSPHRLLRHLFSPVRPPPPTRRAELLPGDTSRRQQPPGRLPAAWTSSADKEGGQPLRLAHGVLPACAVSRLRFSAVLTPLRLRPNTVASFLIHSAGVRPSETERSSCAPLSGAGLPLSCTAPAASADEEQNWCRTRFSLWR